MKVIDFWTNEPGKISSDDEFQSLFDIGRNVEHVTQMGYIDFFNRILTLDLYPYLGDPRDKVALEIGFGGGRLLNAASKVFKWVYGVDIHNGFQKTQNYLHQNSVHNVGLLSPDDLKSLPDRSIDFVFSFIVFQHFSRWSEVDQYLDEIERLLTTDGCGILYFGRNDRTDRDVEEAGDRDFEEKGYSLVVNPDFVFKEMFKRFEVIECESPTKRPWITDRTSAQFYVKFIRKS